MSFKSIVLPEGKISKKITHWLIFLILIMTSVYFGKIVVEKVRALPSSILRFSPTSLKIGPNQSFNLDAIIDPNTNQVTAVELHVTYDASRFRLNSISTAGSPFNVILAAANINNTSGTASIVVGIPTANPPAPVTTTAKIATLSFNSLTSATANSSISFTAESVAAALTEGSTNVITQRNPAAITVDTAAPTGGSVAYTDGYYRTASVALTVADGTDSATGINNASRLFKRRSATLSGSTCGTYGTWNNITPGGTYPSFTDTTVANGNCYQYQYLVSDNAGNQATYTGTNTAKVDTVAPTLAQVTAVNNPTGDNTPNYTFSSTEAGSITYGGSCSSATTAAISGNNTITFNALNSSTYSNCTIRVTDIAGNLSNILTVNTFTVDATPPTITSVTSTTPNGTYNAGSVINITVNFSEAVTSTGSVTVTLDTGRNCTFTATNAASGTCNYTVQTGDRSADLNTTAISGIIKDQQGNTLTNFTPASTLATNKNIIISAVIPVLSPVTPVALITNDTTPDFVFSSTKAGTITYSGDCRSGTTNAVAGNNPITFNSLIIGSHTNCSIVVTDSSGNASSPLAVSTFSVTYRADLDLNKKVDIFDYNILIANFGNSSCGNPADADKNCKVDIFDYNALLEDFGKSF